MNPETAPSALIDRFFNDQNSSHACHKMSGERTDITVAARLFGLKFNAILINPPRVPNPWRVENAISKSQNKIPVDIFLNVAKLGNRTGVHH